MIPQSETNKGEEMNKKKAEEIVLTICQYVDTRPQRIAVENMWKYCNDMWSFKCGQCGANLKVKE